MSMTASALAQMIGAKKAGGQFMGRCPAHKDDTASLSFTDGREGLIVNCHAGCGYPAIVDGFRRQGIDIGKSAVNGHDRAAPINVTYDYTDEAGALLLQVVRMPGKKFRQRRPNGNDWIWKLGDTRRVLYRLPNILEAIAQDRPIFIVEGEKDVENLRRLNVVATTNPGGAGKWQAEYSEALCAADV